MLKDKEPSVRRLKYVWVDPEDSITEVQPRISERLTTSSFAAGSLGPGASSSPWSFVWITLVDTVIHRVARKFQPDLDRFAYSQLTKYRACSPRGVSYAEYDRYNSGNPHSAGKAGERNLSVAYQNTYKMPIVVTHTMNVFGERQNPEKVHPWRPERRHEWTTGDNHSDSSRTVVGSSLSCRMWWRASCSSGLPKDYQHEGGVQWRHLSPWFNLVGPEEIDNLSLANMIAETVGKPLITPWWTPQLQARSRPQISIDGALEKLGWCPRRG